MFNKSKAWAITLLVAVALIGGVVGAALQSWASSGHRHRSGRLTYSGYLTRELQLDSAQHDSVVAILHRHQPGIRALFQTIRPQLDSARAGVADEIRGILTPAQREIYQRLLDRDRAERARADSTAAAQAKKTQ